MIQTKDSLFPALDEIPNEIKLESPLHQHQLLINGEIREWNGPVQKVFSPIYVKNAESNSPEAVEIGSYPLGTWKEADEALKAAVKAYDLGRGLWPSMPVEHRIKCIENFTAKMVANRSEIVKLIVWEIGKNIADAEKEFDRTVEYIQESVKAVVRLHSYTSQFVVEQNILGHTRKVPHGVVLCMGPFNYPLNETFTTLIPALLMGNTILFKPPKQGTLLFAPLLNAFKDAFPKGVVNTIYGRGRDIVPALMESGKVDVLALIGSSKVADGLKKMHPKSNRLKSILGLDAKNAAIILEDADLQLSIKEVVAGALSFNGQRCTALKIVFVHKNIVNEFNARLVEEVSKLKIGMPWTKGVTITPLAEPDKPDYLLSCLYDATSHGASILNEAQGGGNINHTVFTPAIVYAVNKKMKLYHEEQFGPIIPVVAFDTLQEPVDYVSQSQFGQQVSIFSQASDSIAMLIDMLTGQVGRININSQCQRSPDTFAFSGRKDSAEGTLSIDEALLAFSTDSVVAMKQNAVNEMIVERIITSKRSKRLDNILIA
jgi:glyceraldehyde-3-phosphate dehydrogenase (NADP+)